MTLPHRLPIRWRLVPLGVVVIAGHLIVPYALSHRRTSTAIASSMLLLMIVKHLGLAGILARAMRGRLRGRH